jgi:cell surface protein SprA
LKIRRFIFLSLLFVLYGVFRLYSAPSPQTTPVKQATPKTATTPVKQATPKTSTPTTVKTTPAQTAKNTGTTSQTTANPANQQPTGTVATSQAANKTSTTPAKDLPYPVSEIIPQTLDQVDHQTAVELRDPSNIKTTVEYDPESGIYQVVTRMGDEIISTPINLTREEYLKYQEEQSAAAFWKEKNKIDFSKKKNDFSLTDMQFDIGLGDKIFGEGGVRLKTQGSVETKFGLKTNIVDNPSLSENARNRTRFDFDQNIQMSVNGKVGDKIDVNMNYDTEAVFDYDAKSIKLRYDGKEDEIIRSLEAGNVSMPINSSLITGGSSLFGIKTELQFGKLNLAAVLSQQKAQTKSVSLNGGVQTSSFEVKADEYDESRHYFLSHYFRDHYDEWISKLPYISSGIVIKKVEVWVTNKSSDLDDARNIVAFADMGEPTTIFNSHWISSGSKISSNASNSLYSELTTQYADARTISQANATLEPLETYGILVGSDYERLESARKLESSEYTLNSTLGYISLKQSLNSDEILAVAYEFTYGGQTYQVGEFSTDGIDSPSTLFVKMLKGTDYSPNSPTWNLMMKNVYSIGAYNLESEDFELNITYQSDSVGTDMSYLTEGDIKNQLLLRVMGLDRLNSKEQAYPDGVFDFKEGYTVQASNGRIIFPVLEPFGSHLRKNIGNDAIAEKYVFEELYDSTLTVAQQLTEKNKFLISGTYKATSGATLDLGATNVASGSVTVTAGGQTLTENVDYTVDYASGTVTILDEDLISSGTTINATCEDQSTYSMVRKTMMGLTADYKFNDNFSLGGTVMHLSETPLTTKVDMGYESVNNTIWGLNTSFKTKSQLLTNLIDKLPFINATKPSQLTVNGEIAQLIAGSSEALSNMSYVDDFEDAKKTINLKDMTQWFLSGTPYDPSGSLFPEASLSNSLKYGYNRSLLAWYTIDGIFTQTGTSQTPSHIKNDYEQLSNHYVRTVQEKEIFPDRQKVYNQTGVLSVMNLAFYPKERGPYNFDADGMGTDGLLTDPTKRWGGIMRRIESGYTNFESNNVEYVEFWMMDPFVYDTAGVATGGDLYINLGELSEDVLKDGKRSFENGLSTTTADTALISETVWGKVSGKTATVYAFDNTTGVRDVQDVGLDGLSSDEEAVWPGYKDYLEKVQTKVDPNTLAQMQEDPFSPLNDPAGDNYHYYRGSDYDARKASILERYKHYNGTDGNSQSTEKSGETYSTAGTTVPDVEDINSDFTLNESERYYQYRMSIRPEDMIVGQNFINDKRTSAVVLKNGETATINWYQFKVPITEYEKKIGSISGYNSIRFIRMFMTGFQDSIILRLASLELVRGDWRNYTKDLYTNVVPTTDATVDISTVSLEENSGRTPINYKLPPGVTQESDPSQPGVYLEDEQSLAIRITNLSPKDARAVYKNTSYDFRQYERLQMFVHAEALVEDLNPPKDQEMTVFMRLGSDYQNNYYEYEIPLEISPPYVNTAKSIWPDNNFFDIPFKKLTDLKTKRNSTGNLSTELAEDDGDNTNRRIKIKGNPSLADVKTIMIGVRNSSGTVKSVEIWINELRLYGFREDGGWAALGSAVLALSDLGTINASGHYESDGFGGLEESVSERSLENYGQYNISMNFNIGKLFPEKVQVNFPLYYSVSNEKSTPKYDPLNEDLLLEDVLAAAPNKAYRDSILNYSQELKTYRSLSLSDIRFGIKSKVPLPIDPANFTFSYLETEAFERDATTEYEITKRYEGGVNYAYSSPLKSWQPFTKIKGLDSPWLKTIKEFNLNFLPNSISASSNLIRDYFEKQSRDLTSSAEDLDLLTVSKSFLWNTNMDVNWDVTKNLKLKFSMNNEAEVEETLSSPVNKELYATEYENWKDTVSQSLREFGTPLSYTQTVNLNWQIPVNRIPVLDFLTGTTAQYTALYDWEKTATSTTQTDVGNTISNQRSLSFGTTANLLTLYNKSDFLAGVNKKFDADPKSKASVNSPTPAKKNPNDKDAAKKDQPATAKMPTSAQTPATKAPAAPVVKEPKKFEKELNLTEDSMVELRHNLKNKRVYVVAVDSAGRNVPVRMRVKDENTLTVRASKDATIKVTVFQKPALEDEGWYKAASLASRLLMSVRNITVNYTQNDGMTIPGFKSESNLFGASPEYGMAPGWDFALGMQPSDYLERALDRGWLIDNDTITTAAVVTNSTDLRIKSSVEIIRGLKLELNAARTWKSNNEIQYMFDDMPQNKTGSFSMTTIALATAFESTNADNGYSSKAFDNFLDYRSVVQARLEKKLSRTNYPSTGFLQNTDYANKTFDPANGTFSENSADVLIPAFLAAYTGKNITKSDLSIFPTLQALLPNWSLSYDGLSSLDFVKKIFRNVILKHGYACTYTVSSFSSYSTWVDAGDGFGFVRDVLTNNPTPSSMYDVGSVTLMERFNPLFSVQATMINGWTFKTEMSKTRSLTLSVTGGQIVEADQDQYTFGTNYKISDFHPWGFMANSKIKNDLSLTGNLTYKNSFSLLRKIEDQYTQASSGNKTLVVEIQGDYAISRNLNMTLYYDLESSIPLVSSYPVTSSDFGFSLRFTLNR